MAQDNVLVGDVAGGGVATHYRPDQKYGAPESWMDLIQGIQSAVEGAPAVDRVALCAAGPFSELFAVHGENSFAIAAWPTLPQDAIPIPPDGIDAADLEAGAPTVYCLPTD